MPKGMPTDMNNQPRNASAMFLDAADVLDEALIVFDCDQRLVLANRRFAEVLGPQAHVLVPGAHLRDIVATALSSGQIKGKLATVDGFTQAIAEIPDAGTLELDVELPGGARKKIRLSRLRDGGIAGTLVDVTEQFRAERLFTDAVARLPVGVAIEGPDGQFTHCNDAFAAPFGLTAAEILHLSDEERFMVLAPQIAAISGEDVGHRGPQVFAEAIRRQRASLEPMEVRFHSERHFLVERAVTADNGRVVVVTETTALKEAEARSLQTLNDTVQSLDEGLAMFDRAGRFVLSNRAWNSVLFAGIPAPILGETIDDSLHRLVREGAIVALEGLSGDGLGDALVRFVRGFGKKQTAHLADGRILLISAHRTETEGYLISFMDVTEQRRAEEEQREADLLLRKIVEACPANFLVSRIDDGKVIYCPPPSRERFGDIDSTLSFFLNPQDRQHYLDALLPTGSLDDYRVQFRRGDGSIMQGLTAARVTEYKGEQVIVSSTRDISELLAMQEELQRQRDMAHQAEKLSALGELLAGVAHELNNPLSIIVGYAQMLEGQIADPVLSKRVDRIAEAANRSARIVRAFLAMARQRPAKLEPCSLNEIATTALEVAGYGLRANGACIETELDPALPPVLGDADQLVQVFSNLIVNSEHALAPIGNQAHLLIRSFLDEANQHCVVEVRDNGPGIPEDILARIFEPFFTTKGVGDGTGIGLAFSHRVVDAHGGKLEVTSREGDCTSFFVRLDVHDRPATSGPDQTADTIEIAGTKVLVLDDELTVGELICDMLEELRCEPVLVEDAREALRLLEREPFDVVLSDFTMAGMRGDEFYETLRRDMPDYATRVAFITGDTMGEKVQQFLSETDRPYLEKPIAQDDLAALLDRLLGKGQR